MTLSGIFFLIFGIETAAFIGIRRKLDSALLPLILFVYHLGLALFYWKYTLSNPADSRRYFNVAAGSEIGINVGTKFVEWLVQRVQWVFHGSYLDLFLLFHIAGFLGLCLLFQTIMETFPVPLSPRVKKCMFLLIFLPGLHFWTAAIGKDSLVFLAINLVIWAMAFPMRRWVGFFTGFMLIFLIRPHVAAVIIVAIGLSLLWGRNVPLRWKLIVSLLVAVVFAVILPTVMDYVGLSEMDAESVEDYIQKRQGYSQAGGSSIDITDYPFPLKFLSYLYRPLFFDTNSVFGAVVSVENFIWLLFSIMLVSIVFLRILREHPNNFFIRFNLFLFLLLTTMFALTTANLGIAIRQKTMVLPSLAILIMTTYAVKRYLADSRKNGKELTVREAIYGVDS